MTALGDDQQLLVSLSFIVVGVLLNIYMQYPLEEYSKTVKVGDVALPSEHVDHVQKPVCPKEDTSIEAKPSHIYTELTLTVMRITHSD